MRDIKFVLPAVEPLVMDSKDENGWHYQIMASLAKSDNREISKLNWRDKSARYYFKHFLIDLEYRIKAP